MTCRSRWRARRFSAVWQGLLEIPYGETWSYADLARHVGRRGASRAVGAANGRNPIAIVVPCHRVIGADGTLTGYGGGLDRKQWLLEHEVSALRHTDSVPKIMSHRPRAARGQRPVSGVGRFTVARRAPHPTPLSIIETPVPELAREDDQDEEDQQDYDCDYDYDYH